MVKIDMENLVSESELTFRKFAEKIGITDRTLYKCRIDGQVSEKLAFKLMEIFPKLYKKYLVK